MPDEAKMPEKADTPAFWIESCASTFDSAWELTAQGMLPEWGAVLAGSQSSGRGQSRRLWSSPPGNLYVSFVLPDELSALGDMAPLVVGYLVQQGLAALNIATRLKWPNDILLEPADGGRAGKAGGILLEERQGLMVAGLGLNLRHAPPAESLRRKHAVPAASLAVYGWTPREFWPRLLRPMRAVYAAQVVGRPLGHIREAVEEVLAWKDLSVFVGEAEEEIRGILLGLTEAGHLRLRTGDGEIRVVDSGSLRQEFLWSSF